MSSARITNLYALLRLTPQATTSDIQQAINEAKAQQQLGSNVLQKAEEWLLNAAVRARYDRELEQQQPELFQDAIPVATTDLRLLDEVVPSLAPNDDVRLGLLAKEHTQARMEARIEPERPLDTIVYVHEHKRYDMLTKWVIYGAMVLVLLGIVWVFAWPLLSKTLFAPSEWDKHELRQEFVQKGWQEDMDAGYVYLPSAEYTSRLALVYRNDALTPVLTETACDMDDKGLCRISVRIDDALFPDNDEIGMGLQDDMALASSAHRSEMVDDLKQAKKVSVSYRSGGQVVTQTFAIH